MKPLRHEKAALALLSVGMILSYAWFWVPREYAGFAWNITVCLFVLYLLAQIGLVFGSPEIWTVVALLGLFKMAVIGCDVWYMLDPWPAKPGDSLCSAKLNAPLGVIGLAGGGILAAAIYRRPST